MSISCPFDELGVKSDVEDQEEVTENDGECSVRPAHPEPLGIQGFDFRDEFLGELRDLIQSGFVVELGEGLDDGIVDSDWKMSACSFSDTLRMSCQS